MEGHQNLVGSAAAKERIRFYRTTVRRQIFPRFLDAQREFVHDLLRLVEGHPAGLAQLDYRLLEKLDLFEKRRQFGGDVAKVLEYEFIFARHVVVFITLHFVGCK